MKMIPSIVPTRLLNNKKYLTEEGYLKLQSELGYLRETKRREIAEYLHEIVEGDDLEDNSEYLLVKNEQALIEGRILDIEQLLNQAEIIRYGDCAGQVHIGSRVTIQEEVGQLETYTIVGSAEANARHGLISNESPMGRALLDKCVGETVDVLAPDGKYQICIISIA
jgi:transcription elongation factor GreA